MIRDVVEEYARHKYGFYAQDDDGEIYRYHEMPRYCPISGEWDGAGAENIGMFPLEEDSNYIYEHENPAKYVDDLLFIYDSGFEKHNEAIAKLKELL